MTAILMLAAALAATSPAAQTFEPLTQAGKDAPFCTADGGVCVAGTPEGAFTVTSGGKAAAQWTAEKSEKSDQFRPLPRLLRLKDGALLVNVGVRRTQMYSGGSAEVIFQRLVLVRAGRQPLNVLEVPYSSDISIRACFGEKDAKQRLDACSDQYTLDGTLKTVAGGRGALPNLSLDVRSTSFPRGVSRDADSLALPPLRKADLAEQVNTACTYRRSYVFDPATNAYKADAPLPACKDFTVP